MAPKTLLRENIVNIVRETMLVLLLLLLWGPNQASADACTEAAVKAYVATGVEPPGAVGGQTEAGRCLFFQGPA